jgi:Ras-related protein Rab-1B
MTTSERFRTITSCYYRGAHGVLLVFDVYNEQSFANLRVWLRELDDYTARDNVARIIVANKCDAPTGGASIGVTFAR